MSTSSRGASFSKVPIIKQPPKIVAVYIQKRGLSSFADNMINLSVNKTTMTRFVGYVPGLIFLKF